MTEKLAEVREKLLLTDYKLYFRGYNLHISDVIKKHIFEDIAKAQQDKDFNTPIPIEGGLCPKCLGMKRLSAAQGTRTDGSYGYIDNCLTCKGTGKLDKTKTIKELIEEAINGNK